MIWKLDVNRSLATIAAAMLVVGTVLVPGCGSDPGTITSQTSKYEVADDASPAATASDSASPADSGAPIRPPAGGANGISAPPATQNVGAGGQPMAPSIPPTAPSGDFNPYATGGESTEALLAFIGEMERRQPQGATRPEQISDYRNIQDALIEAAEDVIASDAEVNLRITAAEAKKRALIRMSQIGLEDTQKRMVEFFTELTQSESADLAVYGRHHVLEAAAYAFAEGKDSDAQGLLTLAQELIPQIGKDAKALKLGSDVATVFERLGHPDESAETLKLVVATFADASDPAVAQGVEMLKERVLIANVDARSKLIDYLQAEEPSNEELIAAFDALLEDSPGIMILNEIRQLTGALETVAPELAEGIYEKVATAYEVHSNEEIAKIAIETVESFRRRRGLIGQPFSVSGVQIDGTPFDWSTYQGKVVLVDFWATWCGPCLEEIPNIKANYDQYREKGFEVVGINLDDDPQGVRDFFRLQKLPWPTVISTEPEQYGFNNPLAQQCGVEAIPFLVLVGSDGNVIALNVRGEALGERLAELLDAPAAKTDS